MALAFKLVGCVVIEVTLDIDNGSALVTGTGSQVTQRTDQVRQAAGSGARSGHIANQAGTILLLNLGFDSLLKLLAGKISKVVISQILQLQLVGSALQAGGLGRGDHGVSQFPNLTDGIFKSTVTVNHYFDVLAGQFQKLILNGKYHILTILGEELYGGFSSLIGT